MKKRVKSLIKHPLIYGSSIVVLGGLAANFFNFLFNLFMSRNLSIAEYGVLASVVSLISFPGLIAGAVSPLVVQFASNYFAVGKLDMARGLFRKLFFLFSLSGIIVVLLFLLNLSNIGKFLHIANSNMLIVVSSMIFFMIVGVINYAFLQAKLAFGFQVSVNILSTIIKLLLGMAFVFAGLSASGAVYAIFISILIGYLITFIPLRFVFERKIVTPDINTKELINYGIPSVLTLVGLTSFISSDIILVKHFFNPEQAGIYAGLSLVARVIFFVSAPIATVMFPIIVRKFSNKENYTNTFKLALLLVLSPSILIALFYALFPDFTILFFLKKTEYLVASNVLGFFGLYMALYSVLFIIATFYLSIKKTKVYIPILGCAFVQIILIYLYHESLLQVITISFLLVLLLLVGFLIYYFYSTRKSK